MPLIKKVREKILYEYFNPYESKKKGEGAFISTNIKKPSDRNYSTKSDNFEKKGADEITEEEQQQEPDYRRNIIPLKKATK